MADVVYRISNGAMRFVLRAFSRWSVEGLENLNQTGPLLVVVNHLSNIDPGLLGASLPRRLRFVAKKEIFRWLGGWYFRTYGAFPLDRDGKDSVGFRWGRDVLKNGGALVVFPEGHRNPKTGMQRATPGAALLAMHTNAAILPVAITGTERLGPIWRTFFPTGDINVKLGKPFKLPPIEGRIRRDQLQHLVDSMMEEISALLPAEYQGVYRLDPSHNQSRNTLAVNNQIEG